MRATPFSNSCIWLASKTFIINMILVMNTRSLISGFASITFIIKMIQRMNLIELGNDAVRHQHLDRKIFIRDPITQSLHRFLV